MARVLSAKDRAYREAILVACPSVRTAHTLVAGFTRLVAAQEGSIPELRGAALGMRQDRTAVEAGIREPWSQGQTEGQVNRLKAIKRAMFGRANFDLLRLRVLHHT